MSDASDFVHCMLIPLRQHYLLLPNITIAEVVPLPALNRDKQIDRTVVQCQWRDQLIPVIDLEALIGEPATAETRKAHKLCVINSLQAPQSQHWAMPCCGVPQLITLNASGLIPAQDAPPSDWLHCQIRIGNQTALIPNLDRIENHLQQH